MRTRANNRKMLNLMIALGVIVMMMLAATSAQAQSYQKANEKYFKMKYKKQLRMAGRECEILLRKRNEMPRQPHITRLQAKTKAPKHKALAEVDPPDYVRKHEILASAKNE